MWIYLERTDSEKTRWDRAVALAPLRDSDRGALPGQGERRRPRTLVIVLFVTEKYNAGNRREWVRPARGRQAPAEGEWQRGKVDDGKNRARLIVVTRRILEFDLFRAKSRAPGRRDSSIYLLSRVFAVPVTWSRGWRFNCCGETVQRVDYEKYRAGPRRAFLIWFPRILLDKSLS